MPSDRTQRLADFVAWVGQHLRGDEKGEAQTFLDRLFKAFGHPGAIESGAVYEDRIAKSEGKGVRFADLVYRPHAIIEMKKRGEDLSRQYRQAFNYWVHLVPNRPRYVVLCNFDEFRVYDFDNQLDAPLDTVPLPDLPHRWGPLGFLFARPIQPIFGNDQVAVTRKAAEHLADCFTKMTDPQRPGGPVDRDTAQRFVLQMLVALFAEDIGLLDKYLVTGLLDDCRDDTRRSTFDLLGGLFAAMNSPTRPTGGRFATVDYFNGGLFAQPARVELRFDELGHLRAAANENWSQVNPEIFGALFEHSLGKADRRKFGAHFTSPGDIMKIVRPTIIEPWRQQIDAADTPAALLALHDRMLAYRVLDPACGSGNFLTIAFRQLKHLEGDLLTKLADKAGILPPPPGGRVGERGRMAEEPGASGHSPGATGPAIASPPTTSDPFSSRLSDPTRRVSTRQFFGLDINPFAVELAKVALVVTRKLAIDDHHSAEPALPLDNLDANFTAGDALIDPLGNPAPWPPADVIIGNPPFLGAKFLKPQRGADYVNTLRKAYPDVPGMADHCVYWIRRAHDHLPECTAADPVAGRAGLVGTQNIRNNQSRVGGLDHVVQTGTIIEAVDNQPWSGEANVHVSIANWVKTQAPALLPSHRRLWFKLADGARTLPREGEAPAEPRASKAIAKQSRVKGGAAKRYDLDRRDVTALNSTLSDEASVSGGLVLRSNTSPKRVFNGQYPRHAGFRLTPHEAHDIITRDPNSRTVIHPFLVGSVMLSRGTPDEYVIDFEKMGLVDSQSFKGALHRVKSTVLPHVQALAESERRKSGKATGQDQNWLNTWWQHFRARSEMHAAIGSSDRYIACCEVTKRPIFCFVHRSIRADKTLEVFTFPDDDSFGILQSDAHWQWFIAKCSKLKSDFRYTPESVFDTFPWPQSPTPKQIDAVATAGRAVRRERDKALQSIKGGLRAVYRLLIDTPGKNGLRAVLDAYGFDPKADLLAQLLALNLEVAARESAGQPVTAPGIPPTYPDPTRLITDDCIRPTDPTR
jgi:hypothetical protein